MTDPQPYPYPARDPRDEAKRLVTGSPSHLVEIDHYVYGGRFDPARPFRALVAGGGTGDATVMLAQQLTDRGVREVEIVHLDRSDTSRRVAEARVAARSLAKVKFVNASPGELPSLGLGQFDYIDCCGVLGQLPDPEAALRHLVDSLAPSGGMGVMLFGRLGRSGVEPVQAALRPLLRPEDDAAARVSMARRLLSRLPESNWLRRNPWLTDHLKSDAAIYDLLLHAPDRVYEVGEVAGLVGRAGLRLVEFLPPARYEPATYVNDPTLLRRLEKLSAIERAAFAEQVAGDLKTHSFYAVRAANPVSPPTPDRREVVPVLRDLEAAKLADSLKAGGMLNATTDGTTMHFPLPNLAAAIAAQIDGKRSLADIHAAVAANRPDLGWEDFADQFARFYAGLHGLGRLFLRLP